MKVLHIVGSIDISAGGPSRSVTQTCQHVSQLGINIELITRETKHPVKVETTFNLRLSYKSLIKLLIFGIHLSKKEVSLIHLQHVWDPYIHIIAWFARRKGIPYVITPRGMFEPWIMNRHPLKKRLAMFLYQRNDIDKALCIHATCEMEKENIKKLGFINSIVVIPNGIDLSIIPFEESVSRTKKIVFLSRIHEKNYPQRVGL